VVAAVCCCRRGPPLVGIRHGGEDSGPRPPHGAYAATISNGLCDHTRAMPRPMANIVRACVCVTLRTGLATFGCTVAHARFFGATVALSAHGHTPDRFKIRIPLPWTRTEGACPGQPLLSYIWSYGTGVCGGRLWNSAPR
jgi:hypothetical protein